MEAADMFLLLVLAHRRKVDQIPIGFRDAVMADLVAVGLDGNGNPVM